MADTGSSLHHPFTQLNWDYHLLRQYHQDAPSPFSVVSDMDDADAVALNERIMGHRGTTEPDNEGFRDQNAYMADRRPLENWLRQKAEDNGVRIDKENPVYFAFEEDPSLFMENFAKQQEMGLVHLQARDVDLSNWSFTFGDHFFGNYHMDGDDLERSMGPVEPHPLHGQVLNVNQLVDALREYGYPKDPLHHIEAQMWGPKPLMVADRKLEVSDMIVPEADIQPGTS